MKKVRYKHTFLILGVLSSSLLFLYINLSFYNKLLKYQTSSQIAFYVNNHYPKDEIMVNFNDWLLQYYTRNNLYAIQTVDELKEKIRSQRQIVVVNEPFYDDIKGSDIDFTVLKVFKNYRITMLEKDFFYYKTREKTLSHRYLIEAKNLYNTKTVLQKKVN